MYKLFVNDLTLLITTKKEFSTIREKFLTIDDFAQKDLLDLQKFVFELKTDTAILTDKPNDFLQKIKKSFEVRLAGGGIVMNEGNEILVIKRNNTLDFPKGHLEKNETMENCAIREVMEETGIKDIRIIEKLPITYHFYAEKGLKILKETHWYRMKSEQLNDLKPQTDEGIEEVFFMPTGDVQRKISCFWKSLHSLVNCI